MRDVYQYKYLSPLGEITLYSDSIFLTALFFTDTKEEKNYPSKDLKIFEETAHWLDEYFKGNIQENFPKYHLENVSSFELMVLEETLKIKYGETSTYGEIAKRIAKRVNKEKMSAQAVGHALNRNPICLIIPCHRLIGKNNKLVGYAGGIKRKEELLRLEGSLK